MVLRSYLFPDEETGNDVTAAFQVRGKTFKTSDEFLAIDPVISSAISVRLVSQYFSSNQNFLIEALNHERANQSSYH